MSIIVLPFTFTVGQTIVASSHNSNFNTIYNDYNGNITTSNLSASAGILDSQLNQITTPSKVSGAALTLLPNILAGAGVIPVANLPALIAIGYFPYVKVSERESSGTNGGSSVTGSWLTRVLNTTDNDTQTISSLGSNQVTLPAGTYLTMIKSPFRNSAPLSVRLQNITASTTLITGITQYGDGEAHISGLFTLSVSSALAIQYQASNAQGATGLGTAASFGTEVYTVAEFTKIG